MPGSAGTDSPPGAENGPCTHIRDIRIRRDRGGVQTAEEGGDGSLIVRGCPRPYFQRGDASGGVVRPPVRSGTGRDEGVLHRAGTGSGVHSGGREGDPQCSAQIHPSGRVLICRPGRNRPDSVISSVSGVGSPYGGIVVSRFFYETVSIGQHRKIKGFGRVFDYLHTQNLGFRTCDVIPEENKSSPSAEGLTETVRYKIGNSGFNGTVQFT